MPQPERGTGAWVMAALLCADAGFDDEGHYHIWDMSQGMIVSPSVQWAQRTLFIVIGRERPGRVTIVVTQQPPQGPLKQLADQTINFVSVPAGLQVKLSLTIELGMVGVHWFTVLLDGRQGVRVPFAVQHQAADDGLPA